ncbi:MAG: isoprenylcysteine carboxylmethyltransferase family protein [Pseudomonadota bacterium]
MIEHTPQGPHQNPPQNADQGPSPDATQDLTEDPPQAPTENALPTDPPPVMIHPPLLIAFAALDVALLEWFVPVNFFAGLPRLPVMIIGVIALLLGAFFIIAAIGHMHRRGTNIPTFQPTRCLVTDGVFAFSRNPIYLGLILAMGGVALTLPSFWTLLATPLVALVLHRGVIRQEEAYLAQYFGDQYRDYRQNTARWFGRLTAPLNEAS